MLLYRMKVPKLCLLLNWKMNEHDEVHFLKNIFHFQSIFILYTKFRKNARNFSFFFRFAVISNYKHSVNLTSIAVAITHHCHCKQCRSNIRAAVAFTQQFDVWFETHESWWRGKESRAEQQLSLFEENNCFFSLAFFFVDFANRWKKKIIIINLFTLSYVFIHFHFRFYYFYHWFLEDIDLIFWLETILVIETFFKKINV